MPCENITHVNLTPGVLDAAAENTFSYGACAGLAIALHDRLGWTLIKVTDADSVFYPHTYDNLENADLAARANPANVAGSAGGLHWLVAHPNGQLVDVDGFHEPETVIEKYDSEADNGVAALGHTSRDEAIDEYVTAKDEPIPLTMCYTFVDAVLARLQP